MFFNIIKNLFGTQNERELKKLAPLVEEINSFEEKISSLSDEELKARVAEISESLKQKKKELDPELEKVREQVATSASEQDKNRHKKRLKEIKNSIFEESLPEVFAAIREASKRTIGLRHFDAQLIGGMVLHLGKISEMTTGEGKTLVATLPATMNALAGESVHVITVNDYLAKRDYEWMGPVYEFMGLTVGVIQHDMRPEDKKKAYSCDIVYGTNNEFGFDYLRDNMVADIDEMVQVHPSFAIVDEVDSILVDEARTPLIISGPVDEPNQAYNEMRPIVEDVVKSQKGIVRNYLVELKKALEEKNDDKAGQLLYLIHKADPKNREFLDITLKDRHSKIMLDKAQTNFDSKMMEKERNELLENLVYVYDEKSRESTFSSNGQKLMKEKFNIEFMLEDIEAQLAELADEDIPEEEKIAKESELVATYSAHQRNVDSIKQLLKAYILFQKDVDYVIQENKIVIVDSFTGRMMPGRRFSDGIHEAIEAKERVEVQKESQTLATITLQNYFRMYDKLAGMTGTAKTEEGEFENIYLLPVVQIPTNKPLKRTHMSDRIYKTEREKFDAVIEEVAEFSEKGRPVLVGTISIEKSEKLSKLLNEKGVKHNVLNAKYHEREAHIIAQAGRKGGVTIATNMAGRGTDILLGGNPIYLAEDAVDRLEIDDPEEKEKAYQKFLKEYEEKQERDHGYVIDVGGLHILGTERHESRRIDNQLRGRSGRQGDPGSSRFYLSLEDDLMRIFGSDRIKDVMDRLGMEEGEVIENPLITRAIQTAQKRVEGQNFEIRKHLLKYDNVMSQQREVIYKRRRTMLREENLKEEFFECFEVAIEGLFENWEVDPQTEDLAKKVLFKYGISIKSSEFDGKSAVEIVEIIMKAGEAGYARRVKLLGEERMKDLSRMVALSVIDSNWKEYLREVDELREGISWRAYAQKDPFVEFQHEAFKMFTELLVNIDEQTAERIFRISAMEEQYKKTVFNPQEGKLEHREYSALGVSSAGQDEVYDGGGGGSQEGMFSPGTQKRVEPVHREEPKVGRNDPCPCGSGKKYKKCCGS